MKKVLTGIAILAMATSMFAAKIDELNPLAKHFRIKDDKSAKPSGQARPTNNLTNHGGPVMPNAHVVLIFWGKSWATTDAGLAAELQAFRTNSNGLISHTGMIAQYGVTWTGGNTLKGSQADVFDTAANPTSLAVTDAMVQAEVKKNFPNGVADNSTVYEVFIPSGYYSQDGSSTSCGGPNLQYCAYHSHYVNGINVKYSIEPYPSCSGCSATGFNVGQNAEHFMTHESREAFTDALGTAWWDRSGYEADDKCAWSPAPFIDQATGYGYQYEWSNSGSHCVQ
jgi:hypothetical protein